MKSAVSVYAASLGLVLGIVTCSQVTVAQKTVPVKIPNAIDPSKAEVMGVHLYMNFKEAFAALSSIPNLKISPECNRSGPCLNLNEFDDNYTPGKRYVGNATLVADKYQLSLAFVESYPFDPSRPEILTDIQYSPQGLATDQDRAAFRTQVLGKYGSAQQDLGDYLCWYAIGVPVKNKAGVVIRYEQEGDSPIMSLYGTSLQITDRNTLSGKERAFWEKTRTTNLPLI